MVHHHSAGCASVAIGKAGRPLIVQGFRRRHLRRQGIGSGNARNEEKRPRPIAGGVPNRFSLVSVPVVVTGVLVVQWYNLDNCRRYRHHHAHRIGRVVTSNRQCRRMGWLIVDPTSGSR
jgi:hypothetical protein